MIVPRRILEKYGIPMSGLFSSAEQDALDSIISDSIPKIYGDNWLSQLAPLTSDDVKAITKAAMYYYGLGYALTDYKSFFKNVQKSLPNYAPLDVTKVLAFISGIDPAIYPADVALLKTGKVSAQASQQQADIASAKKSADFQYEVEDKLKRGGAAISQAASAANDMLPWYLRPKLLIPLAVGGVGLFYLMQAKGALKMLGFKKNPVKRSEKQEKARRLYKTWTGRNPTKTKTIPLVDASELVYLGDAIDISYRSDKWTGEFENYIHEFGKGVKLYSVADSKALVLTGGKMKVEDIGIVN